jgi:LacI family transcriptional regulator
MITARDIATELGIAISTVGRAMADDPRISEEMKSKVRKVADRLGYVGNNAARIMRGGSSKLIGLMIPDVANDFYSEVAQTLSTCVGRQGYGLVLCLTEDDREIEARQIRELVGARAAGIILVPTARPKREAKAMLNRMPHVQFLRRLPNLGDVWFGIDDAAGQREATEYLLSRGHSRIGYIGGTAQLSTGAARASGYRTALSKAKIKREASLEHLGEPTAAFGESAAAKLLHLARPPTAILTGSAHITLGVIRTLERTGIDTPLQVSLIGFGEAPWFEWWRGGLTTIRPPVKDLATNCGLWFLNNLRTSDGKSLDPYSSSTNSVLVQRMSVAQCPA